jgi:peptide/nickel transport system permease protein
MKRYLFERVLLLLPTLFGAVTLVFVLIHVVPGDPVEAMLGETASNADKAALTRDLGLDQPLIIQYGHFLSGLARGDLGRSLYNEASVADLILRRFPATFELSLAAMAIALLISFPLGMLAAARRGSAADRGALLFSLLGIAMPNFWLGPLLMIAFSIDLGWLPVSGRGGISSLVLPALTLGMAMAAILTRMVRSGLIEAMREDYIRTARAKGVGEMMIWLKHALRNSLISVITIAGLQFGSLLAGAIITESIFSWPGLGRLTLQAIQTRDYPLVQGCVLTIVISYLIVNLLTDIAYRVVDPRISYES